LFRLVAQRAAAPKSKIRFLSSCGPNQRPYRPFRRY
jgi:hypothetical protein